MIRISIRISRRLRIDWNICGDWPGYQERITVFSVWNTRDDDLFNDIPDFFQEGLLMERDSHGNFQFSQVKTEQVLMGLVKDYLNILKENGTYKIGIEKILLSKGSRKRGAKTRMTLAPLFSRIIMIPSFYCLTLQ